jgi:hypothetical protein
MNLSTYCYAFDRELAVTYSYFAGRCPNAFRQKTAMQLKVSKKHRGGLTISIALLRNAGLISLRKISAPAALASLG